MSRHRIVAEIDDATWTEISADPRFTIRSHLEILENPYVGCRKLWDFIVAFCRENDREQFTRAEIRKVSSCVLTDAQVDNGLRKLVDNLEINRVPYHHYDLGLGLYPINEAA